MRKLLLPILKLFLNPNPLIQALHIQARLNTMNAEREARREATRRQMDQLYYELIHNLVIETTRLGIEVKNLKMRVESVSSRLEFNERRARALERVVVYKPLGDEAPAPPPRQQPAQQTPYNQARQQNQPSRPQYTPPPPQAQPAPSNVPASPASQPTGGQGQPSGGQPQQGAQGEGPGQRSRRRRRRRGRRGGGSAASMMGAPGAPNAATTPPADASAAADADEQLDAMDRMDDDGSPENEEAHAAAASDAQIAHDEAPAQTPVATTDVPEAPKTPPPGTSDPDPQ